MKRSGEKKDEDVIQPEFEFWNDLPTELKALVVQKMDIKTISVFKNVGRNESELIRNYGRRVVNIRVQFLKGKHSVEQAAIELGEAKSNVIQLRWFISKHPKENTKIKYTNFKSRSWSLRRKSFVGVVSIILRRILTDPMFVVKKLELYLGKFERLLNLGSIRANVECLALKTCKNLYTAQQFLMNENLYCEAVVGVKGQDRQLLFDFDKSIHGKPRSLPVDFTSEFSKYCSRFFQFDREWNWKGRHHLKKFWRLTLGQYNIANEDDVNYKLELPKTTEDITCFRAAYYYRIRSDLVFENDKVYKDKISFLKEGIHGYFGDYQLAILSIAYLVRLFRNEPAIEKVYDKAYEDLRLVLKKYEHLNYYEKLVSKIEALLP